MTRILAFDLSLTRTGWAGPMLTDFGTLVPPRTHDRGLPRLFWIRERIVAMSRAADVVVLEGLSFGSRGRAMLDLAGLGTVIRLALYDADKPFIDVSPSTVKKLATGKGNADKAAVLAAAIRRLDYPGSDGNEADALWLITAGLHLSGSLDAPVLPKAHTDALAGIPWLLEVAA